MGCCHHDSSKEIQKGFIRRIDWLLLGSVLVLVPFYCLAIFGDPLFKDTPSYFSTFSYSVFELLNTMWWGVVVGLLFVSVLGKIPRELVMSILGDGGRLSGIIRAACAGILFDLCSHGILLVGMKLYERGASVGQVMAFLIASPWNSFSLTLILWALIGLKWTVLFLLLSFAIAIVSGLIFEILVSKKVLPHNPHREDLPHDFHLFREAKKRFSQAAFDKVFFSSMVVEGISGSRMVLRWLLFGVILASAIRTFVPLDYFATYFGSSLAGLGLTLLAATIIEVCSEGSTPIAADLVNRAAAPGNGFAFLMTGVSTDYTEIMILKDTTKSWKVALFLPLVTLPQVIIISWLINTFG